MTYLPSHMPFFVDESRIANDIFQLNKNRKIPLIGDVQSNLKIPSGPLYYWLGMPVLIIGNNDPRSLAYLDILLGLLGIAITMWFVQKTIGGNGSTITGILLAMSPAFTAYSNKPFPPVLLLIIIPLFYATLYQAVVQRSTRWLVCTGIMAGLSLHVHLAGVIVGSIAFLVGVIYFWRSLSLKTGIFFAIGYFLPLAPLILFNLRHNWYHWQMFAQPVGQRIGANFSTADFILYQGISPLIDKMVHPLVPPYLTIFAIVQLGIGLFLIYKQKTQITRLMQYLVISFLTTVSITFLFMSVISIEERSAHHILPLVFSYWFLHLGIIDQLKTERILHTLFTITWIVAGVSFALYHMTKVPDTSPIQTMDKVRSIMHDQRHESNVNVVALLESDTAALPYRYFATIEGVNVLSLNDFEKSNVIFVLAPSLSSVVTAKYRELAAGGPYDVTDGWVLTDKQRLYKLRYRHPSKPASSDSAWPTIAPQVPM